MPRNTPLPQVSQSVFSVDDKSPSHSSSPLRGYWVPTVDRRLLSCPLIDISACVRRDDTCSPRSLPTQDSAALSGSMILEEMAGFTWNRLQHLLEPAASRPNYVVLINMNVNEYVPSRPLRNIISAST
jgi:hypothetical protein